MRVVITGANRGIGQAMAQRYKARGDEVIGTSRSGEHALDVTDVKSVCEFCGSLGDTPVDLLICNAGVYLDKGAELKGGYKAELWTQTYAANVTGVFLTIQGLLPQLQAASAPKVAIISSIMASSERAPGGSYIYRSSKAAVLNLGRNLAADYADQIAFGIYHPGWVRTDMGSDAADISVDESADGLVNRFDALSLDTSGVFEDHAGRQMAF